MASAGFLKQLYGGLQDDRLLPPQPQSDAFQKVFTRAGRFTTEWYRVDFDNQPAFGTTATATIPRRGHLITRAILVVQMPDIRSQQLAARAWCATNGKQFAGPTFGWTNSLGHALITQAQTIINATAIDTLDGRLMEVLDEFHTPLEKETVVNRMMGRHDRDFTPRSNGWSVQNQEVAVPLPFWFGRGDTSAALPIDAIGTDTVQIGITFNTAANLYVTTSRTTATTMPEMTNSPFYFLDEEDGTPVAGLNGNPVRQVLASQVADGTIRMPEQFVLEDAYLLLEYIYLDQPEANKIRLADISYPIVNHVAINPFNTNGSASARIPMRIPNPTRELYFFVHRNDADTLNAPFLATRDLSGLPVRDLSGVGPIAPWWPDARGLSTDVAEPLIPAYSQLESEPITALALIYEGKLVRYATDAPAIFRSILPSYEQVKTPWVNKYFYHLPFGTQSEFLGVTRHGGEANLDKITRMELSLEFTPPRGSMTTQGIPYYTVYVWAETYNILRVYSGRAGLLF